MRWLPILLVLPIFFYIFDSQLPRFYIFSPAKLQELSKESIARHPDNVTALMEDLTNSLRNEYGSKHVKEFDTKTWIFNNAGGAMGSMTILHASITEYLIFFGTPLGTEGHSGVHLAHDYFTILSGVQKRFLPGELNATVFYPGDQNHLPRNQNSQYVLEGWALELAQGWIPSMLPFGFLDTFTSTLDLENIWWTTWYTAEAMIGQLLIGKI